MADSATNMPQMSASQASKETTFNEVVDSLSPSSYGGRNADATSALTWGYLGGRWGGSTVANNTISLGASTTTYIVCHRTTGAITAATTTTNWNDTATYARLYKVVTGASSVTSYEDHRAGPGGLYAAAGAGGGASPLTTKGDLYTRSTADARLPVGTDGQVLTADSTQATGIKWANAPYDVQTFYPGVPSASAKIYRGKLARAVTFAANFSGSQFTASVNATASTVFDIQKNGSSVGSCTIAAGGTTPTFASSGGAAVSFAAGDILAIICPASPDATLADPAITLVGTR